MYYISPELETKDALELAYTRRSRPFDLDSAEQEFAQLNNRLINIIDIETIEEFEVLQKRLQLLLQDTLEEAVYDLNRIDEIIRITLKEFSRYELDIIWPYEYKRIRNELGIEQFYSDRHVVIKEELDIRVKLFVMTQKMDIIYKVFVREYMSETIKNLKNRITFLRDKVQRYTFLEDIYQHIIRKHYQSFSNVPLLKRFLKLKPSIRVVVEKVFPVPFYKSLFKSDIPMSRSDDIIEQDCKMYTIARDIETRILRYLIRPMTIEDIQWQEERQKQWNEQINIIQDYYISDPNYGIYCSDKNYTCAICMDFVNNGTPKVMLPCGHCFHKTCIDSWSKQKRTCPFCTLEYTSALLMKPPLEDIKESIDLQELANWAIQTIAKPDYTRDIDDEKYLLSLSDEELRMEMTDRLRIAREAYPLRDILYNDLLDEPGSKSINSRINALNKIIEKANPVMFENISMQMKQD